MCQLIFLFKFEEVFFSIHIFWNDTGVGLTFLGELPLSGFTSSHNFFDVTFRVSDIALVSLLCTLIADEDFNLLFGYIYHIYVFMNLPSKCKCFINLHESLHIFFLFTCAPDSWKHNIVHKTMMRKITQSQLNNLKNYSW